MVVVVNDGCPLGCVLGPALGEYEGPVGADDKGALVGSSVVGLFVSQTFVGLLVG